MKDRKADYAILITTYNRVGNIAKLVETSIAYSNCTIFIHQDGNGNIDDELAYVRTRELIRTLQEAHPNRISILHQSKNLGCQRGVVAAINWAFGTHKYLLILEDDLDIDPSAFTYVKNNLRHLESKDFACLSLYREPTPNYAQGEVLQASGFFSSWGWVTSREKWLLYSSTINQLRFYRMSIKIWWRYGYQIAYKFNFVRRELLEERIDSWAYLWQFSLLRANQLTLYPWYSLTTNLGFGQQSTHTKNPPELLPNMESIIGPKEVKFLSTSKPNKNFDWEILKVRYSFSTNRRIPKWLPSI
jgi:hypothetical protein